MRSTSICSPRSMSNCSPPSSLSLTSRSLENCHGEEEESDEEEGDEDEIEESDGAAEVTASSADDAAEPERKADISERLNASNHCQGPPKGSKHALTQRLYKIKFDDGSLQVVLAEDTIDSEAVVVDTLSVYQKVIRRWRESHPPPPQPAEGKK